MISILCFGDSNTWGYDPFTKGRYEYEHRWPGVLQKLLGENYRVLEEGLNGRTTVWDDPVEDGTGTKNGLKHLPVCLSTHSPLDLIIMMLGTNDLKRRFSSSPLESAMGLERLIRTVRFHDYYPINKVPEILVVSPPKIGQLTEEFQNFFAADISEKSREFGGHIRSICEKNSCLFLDAAEVVSPDPSDAIHLSRESHLTLGATIKKLIGYHFRKPQEPVLKR